MNFQAELADLKRQLKEAKQHIETAEKTRTKQRRLMALLDKRVKAGKVTPVELQQIELLKQGEPAQDERISQLKATATRYERQLEAMSDALKR